MKILGSVHVEFFGPSRTQWYILHLPTIEDLVVAILVDVEPDPKDAKWWTQSELSENSGSRLVVMRASIVS